MSESDDVAGCIGGLIVIVIATMLIVTGVALMLTVGVVWGAGTGILNYFNSLRLCTSFESPSGSSPPQGQ
jgi:hypothetical protein